MILHFTRPTRTWLRLLARLCRQQFTHVSIELDGVVYDFQPDGLYETPATEWIEAHPGRVSLAWPAPVGPMPERAWRPWYNCAHFCAEVVGMETLFWPDHLYAMLRQRALFLPWWQRVEYGNGYVVIDDIEDTSRPRPTIEQLRAAMDDMTGVVEGPR